MIGLKHQGATDDIRACRILLPGIREKQVNRLRTGLAEAAGAGDSPQQSGGAGPETIVFAPPSGKAACFNKREKRLAPLRQGQGADVVKDWLWPWSRGGLHVIERVTLAAVP
ncbi:hypothetical protein D3C86_1751830 [compost metagenome]